MTTSTDDARSPYRSAESPSRLLVTSAARYATSALPIERRRRSRTADILASACTSSSARTRQTIRPTVSACARRLTRNAPSEPVAPVSSYHIQHDRCGKPRVRRTTVFCLDDDELTRRTEAWLADSGASPYFDAMSRIRRYVVSIGSSSASPIPSWRLKMYCANL